MMDPISQEATEYLKRCPSTPNCVCSVYPDDKKHYMPGWKYEGEMEEVRDAILNTLTQNKQATIETKGLRFIHATFKIPLFGFIDDVRFYLPEAEKQIHFRSSSRTGRSDLGVNKKRMEKLFKELSEKIEIRL